MSQAFIPALQVKRSTKIQKLRELPVPGEILVKVGDTVNLTDIVGRAKLPGDLAVLKIAEKIGIEAFEVIKGLRIKVGDRVKEGDLICEHAGLFGLFKSRYLSPLSGIVELITPATGHIAVRQAAKPISLDAYISGKAVSVVEKKSVTIETQAAYIQGIFGVGGERRGRLKVLQIGNSGILKPEHLPNEVKGGILVGGSKPTIEVLHQAALGGAVGLVTGSIDDTVLAQYLGFDLGIALTGDENVPMTLIVTEGFGELPMSSRTYELFKEFDGAEASMNGATQVRAGALRPEVIVSNTDVRGAEHAVPEQGGFVVGSHIRIIRVPYFGMNATVAALPHEARKIDTGAYARVLEAKLESGEVVVVPRANVELA